MKKEKIAQTLAVFTRPRLQELVALHHVLRRAGIGMPDVERYLDDLAAEIKARVSFEKDWRRRYDASARRCPSCGSVMKLYSVNTGPRDMVGGDYQAQWVCPRTDCMETVFVNDSVKDLMVRMGLRADDQRTPTQKPRGGCNGKA